MQPCEAALPSEPALAVPWKPTEPLKPIQRATSGLRGSPPGIDSPASEPAHADCGTFQGRVLLHRLHDELADRGGVLRRADGDRVAPDELAAPKDARHALGARDGDGDGLGVEDLVLGDLGVDVDGPCADRALVGARRQTANQAGDQHLARGQPPAGLGGRHGDARERQLERGIERLAATASSRCGR